MSYSWNNLEVIIKNKMTDKVLRELEQRLGEVLPGHHSFDFRNLEKTTFQHSGNGEALDVNEFFEIVEEFLESKNLKKDYRFQLTWYDSREPSETWFTIVQDGKIKERISSEAIFKMLEEAEEPRGSSKKVTAVWC